MKIIKNLTLTLALGFSISCLKQSESIDPIAPVKTMAEIQRESMATTALEAAGNSLPGEGTTTKIETNTGETGVFYLNVKYKIKDMDILESTNIQNGFESLSNAFIRMIANIFIKINGGRTVNIGEVDIPFQNMNLDFQIIKSIKVKSIRIEHSLAVSSNEDFSFIKTFDIKKLNGNRILTYKKSLNQCNFSCMEFIVVNGDVLDLVKATDVLKISPVMSISKLPNLDSLKLNGDIDLQIGLKLPF
jgi:hypothetical protein